MLTDKEILYYTDLCKYDEKTYPAGVFKMNKNTFESIFRKSKKLRKELEYQISLKKSFKMNVNSHEESCTLVGAKVNNNFSLVIYGKYSCKEFSPLIFTNIFNNKKPFFYNNEIFQKSVDNKKPYAGISAILIKFENQDINKISSVYAGLNFVNVGPSEKNYNIVNLYEKLIKDREETEKLLLSGKNFYEKKSVSTFNDCLNHKKKGDFINLFRKNFITDNDSSNIYIMGVYNNLALHVSHGNQKRASYNLDIMMKFVFTHEKKSNYSLKILSIFYNPIQFLKIRINEGEYIDTLPSISKKYPNLSRESAFGVEYIFRGDFFFGKKMLIDYLKENNLDASDLKEEDLELIEINSNKMKEIFEIIKSDWLFYSEIKKVLKKMIATKKSENEWFYDELKNVIKNKTSDEYDEEINSYINLISN